MNNNKESKLLTKSEKKRIEIYNIESKKLIQKGYEKHNLIVSPGKVYTIGCSFGILIAGIFLLIYYIVGNSFSNGIDVIESPWFIILVLFIGIVIHELIHGFTWSIFCENHFKAISFGFNVRAIAPYCTCNKPLKKHEYILGILMPCIILGIIPSIISIFIANLPLLIFGLFQILGACGDLLIYSLIITNKSSKKEKLYFDHPTDIGLILFDK